MKININDEVTVVLTGYGEKIWKESSYFNPGYYDPKTKVLKEQLWVIMKVIGPEIKMGGGLLLLMNTIELK